MHNIQLHHREFTPFISREKIANTVKSMSYEINTQLANKEVVFLVVLNGAYVFAADLLRTINFNPEISFIKVASYQGTKSTGNVDFLIGLNENLKGKTVVIVEDIVDTGESMLRIIDAVKEKNPREIKTASLLVKPDVLKRKLHIDYIGLEIPDDFVVGYGLDYDGLGRNLNSLYHCVESSSKLPIDNVKYFLLFGPPGSGKGTQSKKLLEKYNLVHLSTGDILRKEIETNSRLGQIAKRHMNGGELVPDHIILGMVAKEIDANKGTRGVILDGFPRTVEQASTLDALLEERRYKISAMFSLEVDEDELVKRLQERAKKGGRPDDTPEIIAKRIQTYKKTTVQVADYYQKQDKLHRIQGVGKEDDIFKRICAIVNELM